MIITSWNVNGLRSLKQYHPWNTMFSFNDTLNAMQSDIICFQEVKATVTSLPPEYNYAPDYDCFYSLPNKAYSGVGTICRKKYTPYKCEMGFTGLISQPDASNLGGYDELYQQFSRARLLELDGEGRVVITDHNQFILFNIYFPNIGTTASRNEYKQDFNRAIEIRVNSLINSGRDVIIVGDFNICHREIDHCDPKQSNKDLDLLEFLDHPSRRWFNQWLDDQELVDTYRYLHPKERNAFTCWDTKKNARSTNYGTRIDYILVSSRLASWINQAEILNDINGSDHCPVQLRMKEMADGVGIDTPVRGTLKPVNGCTSYWSNYGGKQSTIKSYFKQIINQSGKPQNSIEGFDDQEKQSKIDIVVKNSSGSDKHTSDDEIKIAAGFIDESNQVEIKANQLKHNEITAQSVPRKVRLLSKNTIKVAKKSKIPNKSVKSFFTKPSKLPISIPEVLPGIPNDNQASDLDADSRWSNLPDYNAQDFEKQFEENARWNRLMGGVVGPKCSHDESTTLVKVIKPGVNKGRVYWRCSRDVGDGPQYQCNFFSWK